MPNGPARGGADCVAGDTSAVLHPGGGGVTA